MRALAERRKESRERPRDRGLDACDHKPVKRQPVNETVLQFFTQTVLDTLQASSATPAEPVSLKAFLAANSRRCR